VFLPFYWARGCAIGLSSRKLSLQPVERKANRMIDGLQPSIMAQKAAVPQRFPIFFIFMLTTGN
jgi:hypothetical protein